MFCSETWAKKSDSFELQHYECINVPLTVHGPVKSKRGHGGVCLFVHENVSKGVSILETNNDGFIWVKLCKDFFSLADDICLCFAYIPPNDSVYFKSHETGFFESLEAGIRQYASLGKIGIIGDLNARCANRPDFIQNSRDFENYIHVIDANDVPNMPVLLPERVSMDTV